jgi:dipeptidyl aminopeptidase/acylaminoacyl peptidase
MLLLQGHDDDEVPLHNAQIMAERAQAMDGTAELKIYPGVGHSSIMLSFARGHASPVPALRDTLAFIAHAPVAPHPALGAEAPSPHSP